MRKLYMCMYLSAGVIVSGCASNNCFKSAASAQLAVTQAAKTVTSLNDTRVITLDNAQAASDVIVVAGKVADETSSLCVVNPEKAQKNIKQVDKLISEATEIMKGADNE